MARHKIVSMLNDADFYSNFISTHQQGTLQLFSFSQKFELTAVPKRGLDGSLHHCFGQEMDVKAET